MRWLIFLSKVAFLCGIMVILAFSLLFSDWNHGETISSSIITSGYVLALVVLPVVNAIYLLATLFGRKIAAHVPRWLIVFNIFCFLLLLAYIFYLNDPYYHQS